MEGNLLKNGSFEEGTNPGCYANFGAGGINVQDWSITRGEVSYMGTHCQPSHGKRCLELHGSVPGGISQTFTTIPGQRYRLTFDLAGNPEPGPPVKRMRVTAADKSADFEFYSFGKTWQNPGWMPKTWEFTAEKESTTLQFDSLLAGGNAGCLLDNIAVVAVEKQ